MAVGEVVVLVAVEVTGVRVDDPGDEEAMALQW